MSGYVKKSIQKGQVAESRAGDVLTDFGADGRRDEPELRHGEWIHKARASLKMRRFSNPAFALVLVFGVLFAGSIYLFENLAVTAGTPLYGVKIAMGSLFAVSLGFILSVWWNVTAQFDSKILEAQRIDREYRELLISFSDSLFDIINALNTLATKPPRPFVIATEFLLGEYIHLLQSQLQRYGDYIAGLGFNATDFLDEKIRIFEGIRERARLSIKGMPRDIESLFVEGLSLQSDRLVDVSAQRQSKLQEKLQELSQHDLAPEGAETPEREPVLTS
jgi:hypothetical protein